jgi:hypothetical protein
VVLNVAAGGTVIHSAGADSINSLSSTQPFWLNGGSLTVANTVQVSNTFLINGGNLLGHATVFSIQL